MKKKVLFIYVLILTIGLTAFVYQMTYLDDSIQKTVREWSGKEFLLTDETKNQLRFQIEGDSINLSEFIVISYLDSTTCTSCRIKAFKEVMDRMQKDTDMRIRSLLIIDSKTLDDIKYAIQQYKFNYPYIIDNKENLSKLNGIPKDDKIRTFLVDSTFHVILIGNPILNTKIYDLFKNKIKG